MKRILFIIDWTHTQNYQNLQTPVSSLHENLKLAMQEGMWPQAMLERTTHVHKQRQHHRNVLHGSDAATVQIFMCTKWNLWMLLVWKWVNTMVVCTICYFFHGIFVFSMWTVIWLRRKQNAHTKCITVIDKPKNNNNKNGRKEGDKTFNGYSCNQCTRINKELLSRNEKN